MTLLGELQRLCKPFSTPSERLRAVDVVEHTRKRRESLRTFRAFLIVSISTTFRPRSNALFCRFEREM